MDIRIPRSSPSRRERTYALLIRSVPNRHGLHIFKGCAFRTGSVIDVSQLRPSPDYPEIPLLLEYCGNDRSGRGHNRSNDIHILWKFNTATREFKQIARVLSQGHEWYYHLAPIVRREMRLGGRPPNFVEVAGKVATKVLAVLDGELEEMEDEGRVRVMSFLYDQFTARLVSGAA